jgi:hypothetical protein
MENERMTHVEQAVLLWPLLALAARTQQILGYAAVEGTQESPGTDLNAPLDSYTTTVSDAAGHF